MTTPAKPPRKLSREARREQLIEATIAVLAVRGYARATLTEVADTAGLSHGLVNFHFTSKDILFSETLGLLDPVHHTKLSGLLPLFISFSFLSRSITSVTIGLLESGSPCRVVLSRTV